MSKNLKRSRLAEDQLHSSVSSSQKRSRQGGRGSLIVYASSASPVTSSSSTSIPIVNSSSSSLSDNIPDIQGIDQEQQLNDNSFSSDSAFQEEQHPSVATSSAQSQGISSSHVIDEHDPEFASLKSYMLLENNEQNRQLIIDSLLSTTLGSRFIHNILFIENCKRGDSRDIVFKEFVAFFKQFSLFQHVEFDQISVSNGYLTEVKRIDPAFQYQSRKMLEKLSIPTIVAREEAVDVFGSPNSRFFEVDVVWRDGSNETIAKAIQLLENRFNESQIHGLFPFLSLLVAINCIRKEAVRYRKTIIQVIYKMLEGNNVAFKGLVELITLPALSNIYAILICLLIDGKILKAKLNPALKSRCVHGLSVAVMGCIS